MRKPLQQYTTNAVILLTSVIFFITVIATIFGIKNSIKFEDQVNLSDIYSNCLNIVALYVTVFVVINITSQIADSGKTTDVEKSLVIERIKALHSRIEDFHNKVESGTLGFQQTILDLDRIERISSGVLGIVNSADSTIGAERSIITQYRTGLEQEIQDCRDTLTYTPPRGTPSPLITISNDDITVSSNGIQAAAIILERMKSRLDRLLLAINRA